MPCREGISSRSLRTESATLLWPSAERVTRRKRRSPGVLRPSLSPSAGSKHGPSVIRASVIRPCGSHPYPQRIQATFPGWKREQSRTERESGQNAETVRNPNHFTRLCSRRYHMLFIKFDELMARPRTKTQGGATCCRSVGAPQGRSGATSDSPPRRRHGEDVCAPRNTTSPAEASEAICTGKIFPKSRFTTRRRTAKVIASSFSSTS